MTDIGGAPSGMAGRVPVHRRSIEFSAFDDGEVFTIEGRLRDVRPWAEGGHAVHVLHDIELSVTLDPDDLVIRSARARLHTYPHAECPAIEAAFAGLAGLSVARGYTRQVTTLFGGPLGCTHVEHLARALGPVAIQTVTSRRARAVLDGDAPDIITGTRSPWAIGSCHVWAEGGVAQQKLAAGWRPGVGPYPAPALVTFRPRPGPEA